MCSVLLLRHYKTRKHPTATSCFMTPELQREIPEGRARLAKSRCSELVTLLALPALVCLAGGAMAQAQEIARPILSTGLRDVTSVQTQATEKLRQPPPTESPFNAANWPPIESIGAGSDIRPFLAPGVPADLTRAALRRAWSTDPAIRDFIGLSENSVDFNAQDGVPGFDSQTRQLLARTTGEAERLGTERLAPIPAVEAVQVPSSAQVR
jgi:Protein of unknown function (DUF3306)